MPQYLINLDLNSVISKTSSPAKPYGNFDVCGGDDNLIFPILEERVSEAGGNYFWVVENKEKLQLWETLKKEQEILKSEILSEDYETGNILPKLKKIARFQQLQLKLASGDF